MKKMKRSANRRGLVERRRGTRFRVENGCFAALFPRFAVVGQIMNVSRGGLAFDYLASEARTNGPSQLQILLTDHSFCLKTVPFRTVSDFAIPREFSFGSITLRRCGVQFGELTRSQRLDLEYFIRFYTSDEVWVSHEPIHNEREISYARASSYSTGALHA